MSDPKFERQLRKAEKNHIRMELKRPWNDLFVRLLVAIVSALIVLALSALIQSGATKLADGVLAVLVGGLFGLWMGEWLQHHQGLKRASSDIEDAKQRYCEREKELRKERDISSTQLKKLDDENKHLLGTLQAYLTRMGLESENQQDVVDHLSNFLIEKDSLDEAFNDIMMSDFHIIGSIYGKLKKEGEHQTKYREQIDLASILCRLSKKRFWATSTDRISHFQMYNNYYYDALFEIAKKLQTSGGSGVAYNMPCFARIFIGELHSFAADLIDKPGIFFTLYRKHVLWAREKDPNLIPIRFYIDDPNSYLSYDKQFEKHKTILQQYKAKMRDFMLVDDRFVYGRAGEYSEEQVTLKISTQKEVIALYEELYPKIWKRSILIEELVQKIHNNKSFGLTETQQQEFMCLCKIAESKLDIHSDYAVENSAKEVMFPREWRMGKKFFERVCYHIEQSKNLIVAVDRADRKTGNVQEAWSGSQEYKDFHDACAKAADAGADVCRLYILEKEPKRALKKKVLKEFIEMNRKNSIKIGFVQAKYLSQLELELEFIYDFILVNMPGGQSVFSPTDANYIDSPRYQQRFKQTRNDCLGFELLGEQSFIAAGLTWTDNLIAKDLLLDRLKKFTELWNNSNVIKLEGFNKSDVEELMQELYLKAF